MANVRLLRQALTDYDKKVNQANAGYSAEYDAYAAKVNEFNNLPYVMEGKALLGGDWKVKLSNGQSVIVPAEYKDQRPEAGTRYMRTETVTIPGSTIKGDPENGVPEKVIPEKTLQLPRFGTDPSQYYGAPVNAPTQSTPPRLPSLTERDYAEIANPSTDQAGVAIANAKGYTGNSPLVAENQSAARMSPFQSAFNDPQDPQNLKSRGILARTLGGQLG